MADTDTKAAELAASVRLLPARAGSGSAAARRVRDAWQQAEPIMRAQASVLLRAEGVPVEAGGEALDAVTLPRSLALPVLASEEDWSEVEPDAANAVADSVLQRLASAGYEIKDLSTLDVIASAWLPGPPGSDVPARQIERVAQLLSVRPLLAADMLVAEGLARAAHRASLRDRHGLATPEEIKRAIAGMTYAQVTATAGYSKTLLSRWTTGIRRITDEAALWVHQQLEDKEGAWHPVKRT
ncbi:hypothetical protein E2C06_36430 [Dankookia rubra]|uniref:Uncharacterized protein n=1 Tax=Dankookia rubra TaxID=1442381 RepID=A0A4R5Q324_9PROT|nr:hypothetical protein [Dankookia rubra]TDH56251.1 hypothetical protein E2C06_36430 [Dankookia rubra]